MEDLYRAVSPGLEFIERDDETPKMRGAFTVFNRWTEIDSAFEGHFVERIQPGAFTKTIKENLPKIRVLFSHGKDPQIGIKPLGTIDVLRDDASFEVSLLDAPYVTSLVPAMKAGLLGASFHASVVKMDEDLNPKRSDFNREAIPERTYTELRLREFGPTPFPKIDGTEVVVRSMTDEVVFANLLSNPDQIRKLMAEGAATLDREEPDPSTPDEESRRTQQEAETREEEKPSWLLS